MSDFPIILDPPETADASVIWLHGLGADGHDFAPVPPQLGEAITRRTRFVFPHAPFRPVTINGGYTMRAWFDILDGDLSRRADEVGVRESAAILEGLIAAEAERGIEPGRIILAGFSQGGAIALHAGIRHQTALGGILALSTYLPIPHTVEAEAVTANAEHLPIFMAHGLADDIIHHEHALKSKETLESLGYAVQWRSYPMPHAVCPEEIADIAAWLGEVLG